MSAAVTTERWEGVRSRPAIDGVNPGSTENERGRSTDSSLGCAKPTRMRTPWTSQEVPATEAVEGPTQRRDDRPRLRAQDSVGGRRAAQGTSDTEQRAQGRGHPTAAGRGLRNGRTLI